MELLTYIEASISLHDRLNPKIWNSDMTLRDDVESKLNEIVEEFAEYVELPLVIIDVHIVGSNASYNYTDQSDLDLHIIVNFDRLDASHDVTEALMWADKKMFNDDYDLSIRGVEVEIYVEDVKSNTTSNGIYSLVERRWIKEPQPINITYDEDEVAARFNELESDIITVLDHGTYDDVADMIDDLYMMRKNSLSTEGEFGVGNLVFKEVRNSGYLDDLKQAALDRRSDELSIK